MAFEDVAKRISDGKTATTLPQVTPANRTVSLVKAWVFLLVGIAVAGTAGVVTLLWYSSLGAWEVRGLVVAIGCGIALIVKSTMLFDAASNVEPLPRASLTIKR